VVHTHTRCGFGYSAVILHRGSSVANHGDHSCVAMRVFPVLCALSSSIVERWKDSCSPSQMYKEENRAAGGVCIRMCIYNTHNSGAHIYIQSSRVGIYTTGARISISCHLGCHTIPAAARSCTHLWFQQEAICTSIASSRARGAIGHDAIGYIYFVYSLYVWYGIKERCMVRVSWLFDWCGGLYNMLSVRQFASGSNEHSPAVVIQSSLV
jgi:hypothetical protein